MKIKMLLLLTVCSFAMLSLTANSHCEIPCGIYGDQMRIEEMAEHITTLEKSMNQIETLSAEGDKNYNQLVRWITNKDLHADKLQTIVYQYWMNQRITPVEDENAPEYKDYVQKITLLHSMLVSSMKCKQTTDLQHIRDLREQLESFENAYFTEEMKAHKH